ncbi:MAG: AAA family ATPase [Leptospiraceae bacterium]|nr:AAA family ATPase [Leptospiraceae bacterium]
MSFSMSSTSINNLPEGKEAFVRDIISETGYVRNFYEQMKIASGEGVFERFFITGVSPIMLDELASGFNIMSNMTGHPQFNEMLGFTAEEVRGILDKVPLERFAKKSKEEVFLDMTTFYNGYLFSEEAHKKVFNSDMVLYFLQYFHDVGYPKEILDFNVKTDYSKLKGLIVGSSGKENLKRILEEINTQEYLTFQLVQRFTFENRLKDYELKSLLFFFGLLTMTNIPNRFVVPNQVIKTLHWEYFQNFLEENGVDFDVSALHNCIAEMSESGKVEGLKNLAIDFFQNKLSNFDFSAMTEKHIKFMFISYFTLSKLYSIISERELPGGKRIDLLFEAHPAYYHYVMHNFIMEFKYIYKKDSPSEARAKREAAISQAKEYYETYKRDFKQFGRELHSMALIVTHDKQVEFVEVAGF